jgi:hypothetical protein
MHTVPALYSWHPPSPSQRPFVEHEVLPLSVQMPRGSGVDAAMGEQRPMAEGRAQLEHAPAQGPSQHTPSTQKPLAQSVVAWQLCPRGFGPQLPFTQACPGWHSSSVVHEVAQAPFEQLYGQQFWTPAARQVPLPSHVPAVLRRDPAHDGCEQIVSAA